jgi:hypothetical protein
VPNVDGLAFDRHGTLYAASDGTVYSIPGTASAEPRAGTPIAQVPGADGLALGASPSDATRQFLVANRIDGIVTRVDLGSQPAAGQSNILTGGTRGDFAAADSHGCLYATQSDRLVRIAPADAACQLIPSTPGIRAQVPSQLALQCTSRRLVLIDVLQHGNHVDLFGAADRHLVGRRVQIFLKVSGKAIASAVVGADGFFRATAPLPPASIRDTNRARYQARIGHDGSLDLKLSRRMMVSSVNASGGIVTIRGHVVGPLARPVAPITVERRVSCSRYVTVTRTASRPDGSFTATVQAPARQQAAVYRAATFVRKNVSNAKRFPTFTLPRVVALN